MQKIIFIICSLLIFTQTFSQNLIINGGFESGTANWGGWWSRDAKAGATVVITPIYSGTKALKINYSGAQDWSFPVNKQYPVNIGDLVIMSAWVNAESIGSSAEMSVELMDSKGVVTNWVYAACPFSTTAGQFKQFKKSFIVPSNVAKIVPRFEGYGANNFVVDDVSLTIISGQTGKDNFCTLENDSLKAIIAFPSMKITALNKVNSKTYTSGKFFEYSVSSADSSIANQLTLHAIQVIDSIEIVIKLSLSGNVLDINLSGDSFAVLENDFNFPPAFESSADEFLVIPRGTGVIWPVNKNYFSSSFVFYDWKSTMSFIGVTNMNSGYMIVTDDPWDTEATLDRSGTSALISPGIIHHSAKGIWSYNRNLHYVFVSNGYNEMCKWYRNYVQARGYLKTLNEKAIENPNVERLKGAADFWVINMNFSQTDAKNFIKYGLDRALFSLNGYESALPKLIDTLNSKGFLSSKYDIFTDVWPPDIYPTATGYRRVGYPEDVIIKQDGNYQEGWMAYVNGNPFQGYVTCSQTHSDYANTIIPPDLALNHYNTRFIDVELASALKECYSPAHPVSRKTDAKARIDALNIVKNSFSLVTGAEEARDFAFPVVDYAEGTMTIFPQVKSGYDWSTPIDTIGKYYEQNNLNPAGRVPLHGLVYHDVHIPTWYTGDGVSKVPSLWDDKDLFNILYASMPLFMPPNRAYWNTNFDRFLTSYHLNSSITRDVAFEEMIYHSFLSPDKKLQQTEFSNGWKVTVNFDIVPRLSESRQLAAKGFYASDGNGQEVFRIYDNTSNLAVASTENRLFINPYGIEKSYKGVKTTGSVFLRNDTSGIHLAFIGSQKYIMFNPSQMPWKLGHAYSETSGKLIPMSAAGGGWLLLNRPANESFIRFDHDTVALSITTVHSQKELFDCFPNPVSERMEVSINLSDSQIVQITLYNLLGQPVKELFNDRLNAGFNSFDLDIKDMVKTSYILVYQSKNNRATKKILIQ